jgi:pyruvate/2-oxoglutarate dehydrogenase complex dihydrolipoamide acyltransferase (E2) component
MQADIILPDLGAAPLVLSLWFADTGDEVYQGDRLVEILAGGATFDVPAPATGRLTQKHALPDEPLAPGQVLGVVEVATEDES